MDRELNDFREKSDGKAYAHFGKRCTLKDDWVWDYVTNPVVYNFKQPLHQTELRPARL